MKSNKLYVLLALLVSPIYLNAQEINTDNFYGNYGKKIKVSPAYFSQIDTFSLFQSGQNQTWDFSNIIFVDSITNPVLYNTNTEVHYFIQPIDAEYINNCSNCPSGAILPTQFTFGHSIETKTINQEINKQEVYFKKIVAGIKQVGYGIDGESEYFSDRPLIDLPKFFGYEYVPFYYDTFVFDFPNRVEYKVRYRHNFFDATGNIIVGNDTVKNILRESNITYFVTTIVYKTTGGIIKDTTSYTCEQKWYCPNQTHSIPFLTIDFVFNLVPNGSERFNIRMANLESLGISSSTLVNPQKSAANFRLYPNPTSGILNFGVKQVEHVDVFNLQGQLIMSSNNCTQIDVSSLNNGVYFVKITQNGKVFHQKVIKQ